MAGTFLKPAVIAKEALLVLENNLVMANLVYQNYAPEFQAGVGGTVSIRIPTTFTSATVASTVNLATAVESSVTVCLDTQLDITTPITDRELTMEIADFSMQIIQPMMRAHAQAVDYQIAKLGIDIPYHYPVSSIASVSDITNARSIMNVNKVPMTERKMVLGAVTEGRYIPLEAFLHADKRGDGGQALREAELGRVLGFDTFMDQNVYYHAYAGTASALTDVAGASSAGTAGATTLVIYSLGTAQVLQKGELFKIANISNGGFVLTAGATLSGGIATVSIYPALPSAVTDGWVVTFQASHYKNLMFHKNAFSLVTRPLAPPLGGAESAVLNYKGLSCRVAYDYTMMTKTNLMSIDILLGTKVLNKELAVILTDAN